MRSRKVGTTHFGSRGDLVDPFEGDMTFAWRMTSGGEGENEREGAHGVLKGKSVKI